MARIKKHGKYLIGVLIMNNKKDNNVNTIKYYKYSELSQKAKKVAQKSYLDGWQETHHKETLTDGGLDEFCKDIEDEVLYNEDGTDNKKENYEN